MMSGAAGIQRIFGSKKVPRYGDIGNGKNKLWSNSGKFRRINSLQAVL
jgi:hypothetical protein